MLFLVDLASFDDGSEELDRRPDHARQVQDEHDESLQDHEAGEEATLEREQDDDPGEGFCYGADGDAVGDDPMKKILSAVPTMHCDMWHQTKPYHGVPKPSVLCWLANLA